MSKARVTRIRQLTPGQAQRLDALRKVAQLLDSAFVLPGTSMRVGLDPILGLVPGLGDLISPLFTLGILWQARELGIPKVVQLRMIFNVAIDTVVGLVPVLGDAVRLCVEGQRHEHGAARAPRVRGTRGCRG